MLIPPRHRVIIMRDKMLFHGRWKELGIHGAGLERRSALYSQPASPVTFALKRTANGRSATNPILPVFQHGVSCPDILLLVCFDPIQCLIQQKEKVGRLWLWEQWTLCMENNKSGSCCLCCPWHGHMGLQGAGSLGRKDRIWKFVWFWDGLNQRWGI